MLIINPPSIASVADGSITPAKLSQPYTQGSSVATTSGTSIDFGSIPSWATRIVLTLKDVSATSAYILGIQLGDAGGIEATGYSGNCTFYAGGITNNSTYFGILGQGVAAVTPFTGIAILIKEVGSNLWTYNCSNPSTTIYHIGSGNKTLSDTLTTVRLLTTAGTFDSGSASISWE